MNQPELFSVRSGRLQTALKRSLCMALICVPALGLVACGNRERTAGQVLARVNGSEITLAQINDELRHSGIKAERREAATKQLVESLINRQLILAEAVRNEIDRDTDVVLAVERAKTRIITQAYLRNLGANIARPSLAEIDEYYRKHREYFAQRKQFDMQQLIIASKDFSNELRLVVDSARSPNWIAAWLDRHKVPYLRGPLSCSSADLPERIAGLFETMRKGDVFVVNEGEHSLINLITDIRKTPVTVDIAAPQIEQYLLNLRIKEAAEAEIARLRASAKIEYLDAPALALN